VLGIGWGVRVGGGLDRIKARAGSLAAVGVITAIGAGAFASPAMARPPSPYRVADLVRITHFAQEEGALLGVVLPGGSDHFISLVESPLRDLSTSDGPAAAVTNCTDSNGQQHGRAVHCTITISSGAHSDSGDIADVVAHEVFHVFQAVMGKTIANGWRVGSAWLTEGSAAWVGSDLVSDDTVARAFWAAYLANPSTPLFSRKYSAIGWFGHLASSGIDLWKRFPAIFATTSNAAAYATATLGTTSAFFQDEASVFFNQPAWGASWDQENQQDTKFANENVSTPDEAPLYGLTPFKPHTIKFSAGDPPTAIRAAPYGDTAVKLDLHLKPAKPFLTVTVLAGHARIHAADGEGNVNAVDPAGVSFCALRAGCSCPGSPVQRSDLILQGDLAVTGGPTGAKVELESRGCDLKPRPCSGLVPNSDFTEIPGDYDPSTGLGAKDGPLYDVLGPQPDQCIVEYNVTAYLVVGPTYSTVRSGIYSLNTLSSDTDAHKTIMNAANALHLTAVSGIGDEAYVAPALGFVRVRNDVFTISWLAPGIPPGVTVDGVLQNVAQTLSP
jgi:hypothetical protein